MSANQPLVETRCKQGKLIITDQMIRVELGGFQSHSMSRSSLTGVDYKMVVPSLFGMGGGGNLVFHGTGGERLHVDLVKAKAVKQIMQLLGY